ncbi:RNA polymerase sigma-70 region 1.2 [Artemisia annua]|uniref:RNA polymerase sigma-70 region 1.2 n=1 Tax=Artemisia annua TaxID=35608 RepID=A0A2U1MSX6_ARTAN|nr:RNA polymerase sigma-70 region 1.2 [Artemisia annua]
MYTSIAIAATDKNMSCLLPQFKCLPDSFSIQFKTTLHSNNIPKCREPTFFPTRCILSTTAPPVLSTETTVLNLEKLKLSSLEVHSNSGAADRQWSSSSSSSSSAGVLDIENFKLPSLESHTSSTSGNRPWAYSGAVGQGTSLPSEFVTTEYADAAAEAIALARAAVKVAKSAAAMMMNHQTPKPLITKSVPTVPESDNSINDLGSLPSEEDEPTAEELQLLEEQLSASIAVRSKRQVERKERRIRAAEKAEAGIVSVKSAGRRVAASTVTVKPGLSRRRGEKKDVLAFLGGMTNAKLLTAAEEVELSKGIQDLLKLQEVHKELTTRFGVEPTFAEWAAAAHIDQIQLGRRLHYGEECRDKMIRSNIRLVISVARGYYGTKVHLQDIVQEGIRGLVKSAEKFDASKGFKFSTYAHWWIRQAVQRSRAEQSRIIHVPYYMVEVQAKVNEAKYRLDKKLGRRPTRAEIAAETGLSIKRIQSAEDAPRPARSLDIPVGIDNNTKLTDILDDPDQETPEEILIKQTMSEDLEKLLCTLGEKEQLVIRWRFGLEDGKSRTLQEIGDVMGVSRERVRQIELCAFRKLRNTDRTESLRQYLPQ